MPIGVDSVANQTELIFKIAGSRLTYLVVNEGTAQNNQARSVLGSADRLFHRQTAHRLNRHLHPGNHLSQLIERTGIWHSQRPLAAAFIVPDMVNDEIAAQIGEGTMVSVLALLWMGHQICDGLF